MYKHLQIRKFKCFKNLLSLNKTFHYGICETRNKNELEIWGKAQRESARRPKSDWGKLEGGG